MAAMHMVKDASKLMISYMMSRSRLQQDTCTLYCDMYMYAILHCLGTFFAAIIIVTYMPNTCMFMISK